MWCGGRVNRGGGGGVAGDGGRARLYGGSLASPPPVPHQLTAIRNRIKNLEKFKSNDGDCPTLVCTDMAARGLDLDVDHVIMFDFPSNSVLDSVRPPYGLGLCIA